jgi:diacylglycerol kinase (ATP)
VICNPHSNRDRHRPLISKEIKALEEAEIDFVYTITEKPMDEHHMAVEAIRDGFDTVVASGGDSTVSNIADAILTHSPETRFGILPMGTGNDYATGNGIPRSIGQAVEVLKNGYTETRDVIKIEDRYSVSLVGFGFDITMSEIHLANKTLKGPMLYFWSIIEAIFKHRGYFIRVETDAGEVFEGKCLMLNLGNNRISGGGYPTCPQADMTDGKLDVMFVEDCGPGTRLRLLQLVQKARHLEYKLVHYTQAASVTVSSEVPIAFHTEGEMFYTEKKEVSARVIPGRLNVIVPSPQ